MKNLNEGKVYDAMTAKEKAQLAFKALGINDDTTVDKLMASEPMGVYSMRHPELHFRTDNLYSTATLWALLYWQNKARLLSKLFLNLAERENTFDATFHLRKERCLHIALARIDKKYGLDKETVYRLAELSETEEYTDDDLVDDEDRELADKTQNEFERILCIAEDRQYPSK